MSANWLGWLKIGNRINTSPSEAHSAHTTHAAHAASHASGTASGLLLWELDDHGISCQHKGCNTCSINKSCADDLSRINDTLFNHVNVYTLRCIEPVSSAALI